MAEPKKRRENEREKKPGPDARERDRSRRRRGGGGSKLRRLGALVGILILLVAGWFGYEHWNRGGDWTVESMKETARGIEEKTSTSWQQLEPEELLAKAKEGLRELEGDFFEKNPDAKKIESEEELDQELAEPDPVVEEPPPAAEPSPAEKARAEATKEYNAARTVLRSWSPGEDRKLHEASDHLDRALARAEEAKDEALVTKIQELRYFCLKMHSAR